MTDSCPDCCRRAVRPSVAQRHGDAIVHGYRCPDCGHRWVTSRHLPAYTDSHRQWRQDRSAA